MRPYRYHPEALDELEAAAVWYGDRWSEAALRFVSAVENDLATIRELPEAWPLWPRRSDVRRRVMRRFPYSIIYLPDDEIVVVAVAHHKRLPGYWISRLRAETR
jgi:toxin ParE1/3/4